MPVEIRELVIRAVVSDTHKQDAHLKDRNESTTDKEAIIKECVKQTLKILKRNGER
ncbi:MAG: DUF5908 family protein [Methylococcaceae bacterium]|nr:DUF5908 family protein [Methylococcaceae bacterium]MDD1615181.1 DUF5908 family protein [Methylococcaceae bacterium]